MTRKKVTKQLSDLDPETKKWLDSTPDRTEKNHYQYHFDRLKKSIMCKLNENAFSELRFGMVIKALAEKFPRYEILDGGYAFKASNLYQKLWTYHCYLMANWKKVSPKKNIKSKNSSNTKSTTNSSNMVKHGKSQQNMVNHGKSKKNVKFENQDEIDLVQTPQSKKSNSTYTEGTITDKSPPRYASPPPTKMIKFQPLDSGKQTPIFDLPDEHLEDGSKMDECIQQISQIPTATLSEETVQLQRQDAQDMARANLERVHIFRKQYHDFTYTIAEIQNRTFDDEIIQSFNKPDQEQF